MDSEASWMGNETQAQKWLTENQHSVVSPGNTFPSFKSGRRSHLKSRHAVQLSKKVRS